MERYLNRQDFYVIKSSEIFKRFGDGENSFRFHLIWNNSMQRYCLVKEIFPQNRHPYFEEDAMIKFESLRLALNHFRGVSYCE